MATDSTREQEGAFNPFPWVESEFGVPSDSEEFHQPNAPNRVWRLCWPDRAPLFLKAFSSRTKCQREARASRFWAPALRGEDLSVAEVIAIDPQERALLLREISGEIAAATEGTKREQELWASRMAQALRQLHRQPLTGWEPDPLSISDAISRRLEAWLARAGDRLSSTERRTAQSLIGDGSLFAGEVRVPCHRDFHPRNWLIDRSDPSRRRYGLIDFEHARPDHFLVDFVRVAEDAPPNEFDSFLEGYGIRSRSEIEERLRALLALHAIGSLVWGEDHGDLEFRNSGRRLLARLEAEF